MSSVANSAKERMVAAAGFIFRKSLSRVRFTLVGYFLVAMNLAFLVGMLRSFSGRKETSWQRTN